VDPYQIWYFEGALYLIAYCHWREEVRMFALDRIRLVTVTDEPFEIPADFSVEAYMSRCFGIIHDELVRVRVRFTGEAAVWVRDRVWHPSQEIETHPDGSITATYQVGGTSEISRWILGFGSRAEVLEPGSLREEILADARKTIALYGGARGSGHARARERGRTGAAEP